MVRLSQMQSLPLSAKVWRAEQRIREWYKAYGGNVYVSFSGGKDSTVLLHLVRSLYPDVPAVFCNTRVEYPEIRDFARSIDNLVELTPEKTFHQITKEHGFPLVSKKIAMGCDRYRNTKSEEQRMLRLYGGTNPTSQKRQAATIGEKWHHLINTEYKISEKCCDYLKKKPFKKYENETGRRPFVGTMASESNMRAEKWIKYGCNSFSQSRPQSAPLSIWTDKDIWDYIKKYSVEYCTIYDVEGVTRTGCMYCLFGVQYEDQNDNRITKLKDTHPNQYKYAMEKLDYKTKLDDIFKRQYNADAEQIDFLKGGE